VPSVRRIVKRHSGLRIIELETGKRVECPAQVLKRLEVDEETSIQYDELLQSIRDVSRSVLPRRARRYLARYEKSTEGFLNHFSKKGYPREMVSSLIPRLRKEGFLDDERMAREHIRSRKRNKPRGKSMLTAELIDKGVGKSKAQEVVDDEVSREEEREMARRYCDQNQDLSRQTLSRRLSSRGFPSLMIRNLLDEIDSDEPG